MFTSFFLMYNVNICCLQDTIKVYTKCLRSDLEYKTLGLSYTTTCSDVISILLSKYRMRHRDPNLFYMTMEINFRKIGKIMFCNALC